MSTTSQLPDDSDLPKKYIDIVVDLETLGTAEDAAILQIGCKIPPFSHRKLPLPIENKFEATIAYEKAINSEFSKDADTLDWWEKQSIEARKSVFSGQDSYEDAFEKLRDWMLSIKAQGFHIRLWGNGPEFDNRILDYALRCYNIKELWNFRDNHSMRTAQLFFPQTKKWLETMGAKYIKHTALGDASYEAEILEEVADDSYMGFCVGLS
jgi:hypothetical protein